MSESPVYALADRFVDDWAALDPVGATKAGIAGWDAAMTDYSPEAEAGRNDLVRNTLAALRALPGGTVDAPASDRDRVAGELMQERLGVSLDQFDADEHLRSVRVLGSPLQSIRSCFDLMRTEHEDDWATVAARLESVPDALASWRRALRAGMASGTMAARRQALACAQQAATWGGVEGDSTPFFIDLVTSGRNGTALNARLLARLEAAARAATEGFAATAAFLRDTYAPQADEQDAVGASRYQLAARSFLGASIDLEDAYHWGWDELHRLETEMAAVCGRIRPGAAIPETIDSLEKDPHRSIEGVEAFRRWNQDLIDRTIDALDGTHFSIPTPIRRCEAMIAPAGGAAAMYYTGPSEDFSRPGRTWYPTLGKTTFPLWREVSICYHEGVPGHHLQIGQVRYLAESLSRYQRLVGWVSGHGEGWALYAERLMHELGFLDDPAFELGMLSCQAMRAVRVVVDIGMHLGLEIPAGEPHAGERWTPEIALPFVLERSRFPEQFMRSEVDRYLGLPAQAISYKIGEREWLAARARAEARHGAAFDLRAFHSFALDLGALGLDQLGRELSRF